MFLKKHKFPINLFIILEKSKPIIYSSNTINNNNYIIYINNNYITTLNILFKNEFFNNNSFLVDSSVIDTSKYINIVNNFLKSKNHMIIYNIYYFYLIKIKLSVFFNLKKQTNSIDNIFENASWLERENIEMYNINYLNKKDNRSLLLDYSKNDYPLLKKFPCEGYYEIYYDFFENKVNYLKNEFIEL